MNLENIPEASFIDPNGGNREEIARFARAMFEIVLFQATTASRRSPLPEIDFSSNAINIPDSPVPEVELLENLTNILAASMNAANPGYIGHMDTMPAAASIFGDFAAAAINNNMLSLEMSPVLSRLENALLRQIAGMFGFDEESGGVMLAGGSLANLQALAVARNKTFNSLKNGLAAIERQPVIFASEAAHTSLQKAAMLLGFGTSGVVKVAVNSDSQMDLSDLERKIGTAKNERKAAFCIVATAGTTVTGNIDPLAEIAEIAKENNLWFHVDAAYGGALVFSEKYKAKLAGIERADSVTFNPQKWLYVAKTCAMALFKDKKVLQDSFRISAPYMKETEDFTNIGEISVQGTHRADVLKLWLTLQHIGKAGYDKLIEESFRLTEYFVEQIKKREFLQLASKPETNLVCFRLTLSGYDYERLSELNLRLQNFLLREGGTFLSLPTYRRERWLRAVLLNPFINEKTIQNVFSNIDDFFSRL